MRGRRQKNRPQVNSVLPIRLPRTCTPARRVDSESIADEFGIGTHCKKHDFDNHLKIGIFEGINPSDSLDELSEKTATNEQLAYMAGSTFSRRTNDRDYRAVVRLLFELLHTPQLYHQRAVQRNRLKWLNRPVAALDATNLTVVSQSPLEQ